MSMIQCNKDCTNCQYLSSRTDDKVYPFGYEYLKFGDSVFRRKFGDTKEFQIEGEVYGKEI